MASVINLEQHYNPKFGTPDQAEHKYVVLSLRNRIEPPVNTWISVNQVREFIDSGVTVNIVSPKKAKSH